MRSRLFLVDSSPAVQRLVEQACEAEGCEVNAFRRAHNALDAAKRQKPDVVVVDYHLEDMAFSAFCERLMAKDCLPNTPIISLVGSSDRIDERQMHTMGVKAVLKKPLQAEDLIAMVRSLRSNGAAKDSAAKELGPPPVVDHSMVLSAEPPPDPVDPVLRLSDLAAKPIGPAGEFTPDSNGSEVQSPETPAKPAEPMAEAMRGVFAQLRQSLLEQAERTVSTRLPELVTQEVKTQVESAQTTMDRLLPTMVQDTIKTAAAPLMQELIEKQLREAVDSAVTRWLADATKEHLSRMDQLVMGKAEEAALRQARETADRVVREVAQEMVKGVFEQVLREMTAGLALTR
jgi:DNA-binding response OmpR family regulator